MDWSSGPLTSVSREMRLKRVVVSSAVGRLGGRWSHRNDKESVSPTTLLSASVR